MLVSRLPPPLPVHVTSSPLPPCSCLGDSRMRESGGDSCAGAARAPPLSVISVFTLYVSEAQALGREGGRGEAGLCIFRPLRAAVATGALGGELWSWTCLGSTPQGLESCEQIIPLRFPHLQSRRKTGASWRGRSCCESYRRACYSFGLRARKRKSNPSRLWRSGRSPQGSRLVSPEGSDWHVLEGWGGGGRVSLGQRRGRPRHRAPDLKPGAQACARPCRAAATGRGRWAEGEGLRAQVTTLLRPHQVQAGILTSGGRGSGRALMRAEMSFYGKHILHSRYRAWIDCPVHIRKQCVQ